MYPPNSNGKRSPAWKNSKSPSQKTRLQNTLEYTCSPFYNMRSRTLSRLRLLVLAVFLVGAFVYYRDSLLNAPRDKFALKYKDQTVRWKARKHDQYPVKKLIKLPKGEPVQIPKIQATKPAESEKGRLERERRRDVVKESFVHSWEGYKKHAWLRDEVAPLTGTFKDTFGGWAATLVDSLDTLWILGLKDEFEIAVLACQQIDFTTTSQKDINIFETVIRYLGGFLAAYDISGQKHPLLLKKAIEVGNLVLSAFDTPNRMPITRWDWKRYVEGLNQKAPLRALVSEPGSLSLELTRLSQITGKPKYYDAAQRVADYFEEAQMNTTLPGMWPVTIDSSVPDFSFDNFFTLGGMSDSTYEYLPKQYLILGGLLEQPKLMYEKFIEVAKEKMFFRFLNPANEKLLTSGDLRITGVLKNSATSGAAKANHKADLVPRGQHLTCFAGGMVALASRIFSRPKDLEVAEQLTKGCIWAYDSNTNGIAPEIYSVVPCGTKDNDDCAWSEKAWHAAIDRSPPSLGATPETKNAEAERTARIEKTVKERRLPPGFTAIEDRRYILRPEAIESVFLLWRITGDSFYQEAAWRMFLAVEKVSRTEIAAAAISDITFVVEEGGSKDGDKKRDMKTNSMESFWLAETLKYFYLCFADWDEVSLDEWVLNTEAHPLRRPGMGVVQVPARGTKATAAKATQAAAKATQAAAT